MNTIRLPFFKNVLDSGIVEVWFNSLGYALITAAFIYLSLIKNVDGTGFIAVISYLFLATKVAHGSRPSYEHLKQIYVYPNTLQFIL